MTERPLIAAPALVTLLAAPVANPPPGSVLGFELPIVAWAALMATALVGVIVVVARPQSWWSHAGELALLVPLLGPIHTFGSTGFLASAIAGVAFVLTLEAHTSTRRMRAWSHRFADGDEALDTYRRAYRRAFAKLATVLVAGLAAISGLMVLLRRIAPSTFALSLEARHAEGLAALALVLTLLALSVLLLTQRFEDTHPGIADPPDDPEASP